MMLRRQPSEGPVVSPVHARPATLLNRRTIVMGLLFAVLMPGHSAKPLPSTEDVQSDYEQGPEQQLHARLKSNIRRCLDACDTCRIISVLAAMSRSGNQPTSARISDLVAELPADLQNDIHDIATILRERPELAPVTLQMIRADLVTRPEIDPVQLLRFALPADDNIFLQDHAYVSSTSGSFLSLQHERGLLKTDRRPVPPRDISKLQ